VRPTVANVSEYEGADRERALDGDQVSTTRTTSISICCTQDCITEQPPTRLGYRIGSRMLDGEGAISANYQHPLPSLPRLLRGGHPTYTHIPPTCYGSRILCLISSTYQSMCSHALAYASRKVTLIRHHHHHAQTMITSRVAKLEGRWKRGVHNVANG
jgi:hypothetical protein